MDVGRLTASPTEILHHPGYIGYMAGQYLRKLQGTIKLFGPCPDEILGLSELGGTETR